MVLESPEQSWKTVLEKWKIEEKSLKSPGAFFHCLIIFFYLLVCFVYCLFVMNLIWSGLSSFIIFIYC